MPTTTLEGGWLRDRTKFRCHDCQKILDKKKPGACTLQYGIFSGKDSDGKTGVKVCHTCCGIRDVATLAAIPIGEKVTSVVLYATKTENVWTISNWPGTLKITVTDVSPHFRRECASFTFALHKGSTTDGTYRRLGLFTGQLRTRSGNYLSLVRRIA